MGSKDQYLDICHNPELLLEGYQASSNQHNSQRRLGTGAIVKLPYTDEAMIDLTIYIYVYVTVLSI